MLYADLSTFCTMTARHALSATKQPLPPYDRRSYLFFDGFRKTLLFVVYDPNRRRVTHLNSRTNPYAAKLIPHGLAAG